MKTIEEVQKEVSDALVTIVEHAKLEQLQVADFVRIQELVQEAYAIGTTVEA
jgi:hypothetical protein